MTFSSMPVARKTVAKILIKMVEGCSMNLRMLYVGARHSDRLPAAIAQKLDDLVRSGRVLEVERADFGSLFQEMDCFIVQGGLGTTVEALRMKKPTCVAGPLLFDQRFWGDVCHQKGVGPPPVTATDLVHTCVAFAEGALHPDDPNGWQAAAARQDWGDSTNDGVQVNVDHFHAIMDPNWASDANAAGAQSKDTHVVHGESGPNENVGSFHTMMDPGWMSHASTPGAHGKDAKPVDGDPGLKEVEQVKIRCCNWFLKLCKGSEQLA